MLLEDKLYDVGNLLISFYVHGYISCSLTNNFFDWHVAILSI